MISNAFRLNSVAFPIRSEAEHHELAKFSVWIYWCFLWSAWLAFIVAGVSGHVGFFATLALIPAILFHAT